MRPNELDEKSVTGTPRFTRSKMLKPSTRISAALVPPKGTRLVSILVGRRVPLRVVFIAADHVGVEHGHRLVERDDRVLEIMKGTEQAVLFRLEDQKHQAPFRRRRVGLEGFGEGDDGRNRRGVVVGAVIDERPGLPDVIVVAGDEHLFVAQSRIGSFDDAGNVAGLDDLAIRDGAVKIDGDVGHRHRARLAGLIDLVLKLINRPS